MKVFIVTAIVISFLCFTGVKSANDVDDILDSIFQGIGSLGNLGSTGGGTPAPAPAPAQAYCAKYESCKSTKTIAVSTCTTACTTMKIIWSPICLGIANSQAKQKCNDAMNKAKFTCTKTCDAISEVFNSVCDIIRNYDC